MIDGVPGNDPLTVTETQASVTIRDVNDSPPMFNKKEFFVSLPENTTPGTPLPIAMSVHDPDVVSSIIRQLFKSKYSNTYLQLIFPGPECRILSTS